MPQTRNSKNKMPGHFLPSSKSQGHIPTAKRPFTAHVGVDQSVKEKRGMAAVEETSSNLGGSSEASAGIQLKFDGLFEELRGVGSEPGDDIAQLVVTAVSTAVKAALPTIIQAVREACLSRFKEAVNPHLLRLQFKQDEIMQEQRRDNLRLTGLEENEEESEDALAERVCKVAREVGVDIQPTDISSCHRLGKKREGGRSRQAIVRFISRRKRDRLYDGRFRLKGKDGMRGVFINEDLTPLRFSVLMRAKETPAVKSVSTKYGSIVCKLQDDAYKVIRSPDDLFELGVDNVQYGDFKLHFLA